MIQREVPRGAVTVVAVLLITAFGVVAWATNNRQLTVIPAQAQTPVVVVDFATGARGTRGPVGSTHVIGSGQVPAEYQGQTCPFVIEEANNPSMNNNDLVISSATSVTLHDVESNGANTYTGELGLGDTVTVTVILGPRLDGSDADPVSSITGTGVVTCPIPPPSTEPPPSTAPPSSAPDSSSTTSPPTTSPPPPSSTTSPSPSTSTASSVPSSSVPSTTSPPPPPSTPSIVTVSSTTSVPPSTGTQADRCPPGTTSTGRDPETGEPFRSPDGSLSCWVSGTESG